MLRKTKKGTKKYGVYVQKADLSPEESRDLLESLVIENDDLCRLMLSDSMLVGNELTLFKQISEADFKYFINAMRVNFLEYHSVILNSILTPRAYSQYKGVTEGTVRNWIARGKVQEISISGVHFVLPSLEELMDFNRFLMEKGFERGNFKHVEVYERIYGKKVDVVDIDPISLWLDHMGFDVVGNGKKKSRFTIDIYKDFFSFCTMKGYFIMDVVNFSKRLRAMGFQKFTGRKRGFYFYQRDEEETNEMLRYDEQI